jgi:hypothetical protein
MNGLLILQRLMAQFDNDIDRGIDYLKEHFDEIEEPTSSMIYEELMKHKDEMSKESYTKVVFLGFRCQAGRDRMVGNLEGSASKLPDGKLRRDLIGE